ncbi:ATP-binding protein [Candidatus Parcubacteria bacterium]|nr:ATP-binding protein [Candidatus Parcubacteria bacterium]
MSKKETKKFIDITPHKSLMFKVGQTGYSLQEAISELIDNSVDAKISGKKLVVDIKISSDSIKITDNGTGMSEKDTANAIRLGFSKKKKQLGEFGLGLKTASTFLGKRFTLITSPRGEKNEYVITYSEDDWIKNGSWNCYPFVIRHGIKSSFSGTTIIIENLNVKIDNKILSTLKEELGVRFGPFMENENIEIIVNDKKSVSIEPKILGKRNKFKITKGKIKISGWWAYQLRGLNKNYFGFNTFRRGRLVTTFDKIGLSPNQGIKQIIGKIEIEGVPIAHDKKSWQNGSPEYKIMEQVLRSHFINFEPKPKKILSGYPASSGIVEGAVKIVGMFMRDDIEKEMNKVKRGDIIVTEMTRPHFLLAIRRSGGIVTDLGGTLCHAAIVAREFNIPAIVGTKQATQVLKDGQRIIIDANEGNIYEA